MAKPAGLRFVSPVAPGGSSGEIVVSGAQAMGGRSQRRLHVSGQLFRRVPAYDASHSASIGQYELYGGVRPDPKLCTQLRGFIGIDQHADEFLRQTYYPRVAQRLLLHLRTEPAPLGREKHQHGPFFGQGTF